MAYTHVIIAGPNCWGRGETLKAAFKNASGFLPSNYFRRRPCKAHEPVYEVFMGHADTHINGWGKIAYPKDHEPLHLGFLDYRGVPCEAPKVQVNPSPPVH